MQKLSTPYTQSLTPYHMTASVQFHSKNWTEICHSFCTPQNEIH